MIVIKLSKKTVINSLEVFGHSDYAEYGKDIVCSAISGIVQGMFNAIVKMCINESFDIKLKSEDKIQALIIVKNINDKKLQLLLKALYYQLVTVQLQFPKYIGIMEV